MVNSLRAIVLMADKVLSYRTMAEYFLELHTNQSSNNLHAVEELNGNYGRIIFSDSDGNITGDNWISASSKKRRATKEVIQNSQNKEFYFKSTLSGKEIGKYDGGDHAVGTLVPKFHGPAKNDSEYLLINALASTISKDTHGTLYLMTERIPCGSCSGVIKEFLDVYENVNLVLFYMFDHVNKVQELSHLDFYQNVCPHIPTVNYISLNNGTLEVVQVDKNSPLLRISPNISYWQPPNGATTYHQAVLGIPYRGSLHLTARIKISSAPSVKTDKEE